MELAETIALALLSLLVTTSFHYEAVGYLDRKMMQRKSSVRRSLPLVLSGLVTAHLIEIGFYACVFWFAIEYRGLGGFSGTSDLDAINLYYFAAETYSSLGYGDIVPIGGLRLIASIEPLNGLLLMAWSGAFLYASVHSQDRREG